MACPERKNVKINTFITQSNSSSCWAPIEHFQLRKNCSPIPENSVELICRSFLFLLLSPRWVLWSSNFEISNSPPFVQVLYTISSIFCWNFHSCTILQLPRPQELALHPANTSSSLAVSSPCFMHAAFFSSLPEAFKMNDLFPKFLFLPSFCLSQECFSTLCACAPFLGQALHSEVRLSSAHTADSYFPEAPLLVLKHRNGKSKS